MQLLELLNWNLNFLPEGTQRRTGRCTPPPTNNDHATTQQYFYVSRLYTYYVLQDIISTVGLSTLFRFSTDTGEWLADPGARASRLQSAPGPPRVV